MKSHKDASVLAELELAWDDEVGILGMLRSGKFDASKAQGYVQLLRSIEVREGDYLSPEFVRLVWMTPLFVEWQVERVVERGASLNDVERFSNEVREVLMQVLGVP